MPVPNLHEALSIFENFQFLHNYASKQHHPPESPNPIPRILIERSIQKKPLCQMRSQSISRRSRTIKNEFLPWCTSRPSVQMSEILDSKEGYCT